MPSHQDRVRQHYCEHRFELFNGHYHSGYNPAKPSQLVGTICQICKLPYNRWRKIIFEVDSQSESLNQVEDKSKD